MLTLIGLIPVLGSAAKGVLKTLAKGLKTSGKVPLKFLIEVLNKFHKGNAVEWLRKLAADLPGHAATMKKTFQDILKVLHEKLRYLGDKLPGTFGKQADDAIASLDEVAKIADGKIDEAVQELQSGLNKSLDEGVDFEKKGVTKSNNTRKQTDAEPPTIDLLTSQKHTSPTGRIGGKPKGVPADVDNKSLPREKRRGLTRENESADTLAANGYDVDHHPELPNQKNPDFTIEGKKFDNLAPTSSNPEQVRKGISNKVNEGQADRIVLNLDEPTTVSPEDARNILLRKPIDGLQEVIAIKGGKIIHIFP